MAGLPFPRSSGVLLHPTSLPGPFGIGDLGPSAFRWVETLAAAKQSWWQVLPLGPTGYGDSPYQSYSAFAGNIQLLSPELLQRDGLVPTGLADGMTFPAEHVDFERVAPWKRELVRTAWDRFSSGHGLREDFEHYCETERAWLDDYALFMALRDALGQASLSTWPEDLRTRQPVALSEVQKSLKKEVRIQQFGQFLFDRQWTELRQHANRHGVRILGDAPIFVAGDSSDVWANPEQFLLDDQGKPRAVAGVPPDYFSEDGQLWGNPLYDWDRMDATGYSWWIARLRRLLSQVDFVRLDHFRGFAAAWHVPENETTAKNGRWVDGPRAKLFVALQHALGSLPIIAEDLGVITPDVEELRTHFGLPGMRVLQFMLGGPDNPYWPHNYEPNTVVYTGTHDNDTTSGWFSSLGERDRKILAEYLGRPVTDPGWDMLRLAWSSVAAVAIVPLQDLLGLGSEARMNVPGVPSGNWRWRFRPEQFRPGGIERLAEWTTLFHRVPAR